MTPERKASLEEAYKQTHYRVFCPQGDFTLHIGEYCEEMAAYAPWAFLTACNPGSQLFHDSDNANRMSKLKALLADRWLHFDALGVAPDETWREPSFFIAAIDQPSTTALARQFGQLAYVYSNGGPARLIWVDDEP
jgi:hypothetical protein